MSETLESVAKDAADTKKLAEQGKEQATPATGPDPKR